MKNMKIRVRMLVSYMILVALLLITGIVSVYMLSQVNGNMQSFYSNQFQTVQDAMDMRRLVFVIRSDILNAIADDDTSVTASCISDAETNFDSLTTLLNEIYGTYAGDKSQLDQVKSNLEKAEPYLEQIGDLCNAHQNDQAYEIFTEDYKPLMDDVRSIMDTVGQTAQTNAQAKVDDATAQAQTADVIVIALIVVSVIIGILLALVISRSILNPLREMQSAVNDLTNGNINTKVTYQSKDELGMMANDLRSMTEILHSIITDIDYCLGSYASGNFTVSSRSNAYKGDYKPIQDAMKGLRDTLSDTLIQIDVAADQVSAGSDQVSTGAQTLAQGATEQAASVQELAATINGVSHQVEDTAKHAKTAKTENTTAHDQIQMCSKRMDDLMGAMNEIETKSQDIGTVIKSIEDIAFQTNILALNAAVEAARAGSAGKGFAVVADEVRNLAAKSDEAAKNTAKLIESAIAVIQDGVKLSQETRQALEAVVTSAEKVLDAVALISTATEEQSGSIAQITVAVDQISSVVQANSATSEESAAASEELSSQASVLKQLISKFRLNQSGSGAYSGPMSGGSAGSASSEDDYYDNSASSLGHSGSAKY